ncbi:MAG: hypothetical protein GY774_31595, partial [Planctomycetes bacterium]|nr:hypothetical protein [Planctomycetota bacterium]
MTKVRPVLTRIFHNSKYSIVHDKVVSKNVLQVDNQNVKHNVPIAGLTGDRRSGSRGKSFGAKTTPYGADPHNVPRGEFPRHPTNRGKTFDIISKAYNISDWDRNISVNRSDISRDSGQRGSDIIRTGHNVHTIGERVISSADKEHVDSSGTNEQSNMTFEHNGLSDTALTDKVSVIRDDIIMSKCNSMFSNKTNVNNVCNGKNFIVSATGSSRGTLNEEGTPADDLVSESTLIAT